MGLVAKIATLFALLIAISLFLYRGEETVAIIRSLGAATMGTIEALQGR